MFNRARGEGAGRASLSARHPPEHLLASGLLQGGKLHGRILILGADARVAVFHAAIVGLTFGTRKSLFSLPRLSIPKLYPLLDGSGGEPQFQL